MTEKEVLKITIEEFTRLQRYMLLESDKNSPSYKEMEWRYYELKAILSSYGVDTKGLDRIENPA